MKKQILLVGEYLTTEVWERELAPQGFDCHQVTTMMEAINYLKQNEGAAIQVLAQSNLAIIPVERQLQSFPEEFGPEMLDQYERGAALLSYIRRNGLVASDTPLYLADFGTAPELEEGIKYIDMDKEGSLVTQMTPTNYRPTSNEQRGKA